MPFQIGDVVELRQFPGELWVVISRDNAMPPERRWRLRRETDTHPITRIGGDGDMTPVDLSPPIDFSPGQIIRYDFAYDGKAEVVADLGEVVRIKFMRRRPHSLDRETKYGIGGASYHMHETDAHRGQLVGMNLDS